MQLSEVVDEATGRRWFREQWRRPEFVAEMILENQWEALAILLAHPAWAKGIPASLFANDNHSYLLVAFRYISDENAPKWEIFKSLCSKKVIDEDALLCLWYMQEWPWADYANSRIRLDHCVAKLKKIFAWQYEKTKKARTAL